MTQKDALSLQGDMLRGFVDKIIDALIITPEKADFSDWQYHPEVKNSSGDTVELLEKSHALLDFTRKVITSISILKKKPGWIVSREDKASACCFVNESMTYYANNKLQFFAELYPPQDDGYSAVCALNLDPKTGAVTQFIINGSLANHYGHDVIPDPNSTVAVSFALNGEKTKSEIEGADVYQMVNGIFGIDIKTQVVDVLATNEALIRPLDSGATIFDLHRAPLASSLKTKPRTN